MGNLTLQAINTVFSNLSLRPGSLEDKLVFSILSYFPTDKSIHAIASVSDEELIVSLWDIHSPKDLKEKRLELNSIKKSINDKLKRLIGLQQNPERILIDENNVFSISNEPQSLFPPGHFYSPIVNSDYLKIHEKKIWPDGPSPILGLDFNQKSHLSFLKKEFPLFLKEFNYPDQKTHNLKNYDYFLNNGLFEGLDARTLFVMLRKFQPKQMIEVGSGFSSLLTADVNRTWLNSTINFTCIEPYPKEFLTESIPGLSSLLVSNVENIDTQLFKQLQGNDILFIDSSHVSKTGSDVNYLFFEILPLLKKGVVIHIHDIFLPLEYPRQWVLNENRSWNEQYLLRALLMFNNTFNVLFSCSFAICNYPELIKKASSGELCVGASFWIQKIK